MPPVVNDIFGFLGYLLRALGFLAFGFAAGRFILDNFKTIAWQVQIALILALAGVFIAVTDFATAGSAGAFALGAAAAFFMSAMPKKTEGSSKGSA
jgi:hypothetical protein